MRASVAVIALLALPAIPTVWAQTPVAPPTRVCQTGATGA